MCKNWYIRGRIRGYGRIYDVRDIVKGKHGAYVLSLYNADEETKKELFWKRKR